MKKIEHVGLPILEGYGDGFELIEDGKDTSDLQRPYKYDRSTRNFQNLKACKK